MSKNIDLEQKKQELEQKKKAFDDLYNEGLRIREIKAEEAKKAGEYLPRLGIDKETGREFIIPGRCCDLSESISQELDLLIKISESRLKYLIADLEMKQSDDNISEEKFETAKMIFLFEKDELRRLNAVKNSKTTRPVGAASAAAAAVVNYSARIEESSNPSLTATNQFAQKLTALYEINSQDVKSVLNYLSQGKNRFSVLVGRDKSYEVIKQENGDFSVNLKDKKTRLKIRTNGDDLIYYQNNKEVPTDDKAFAKIKDILSLIVNNKGVSRLSLDELVINHRKQNGGEEVMYC
jgi:predicted Fe-Mo cluster-binding NifX family protein